MSAAQMSSYHSIMSKGNKQTTQLNNVIITYHKNGFPCQNQELAAQT